MLKNFELLCSTSGRVTLGLYFFGPGALIKIANMDGTSAYMAEQGMIFIYFFLILTILIQLFGGIAMVVGYQVKLVAFVLAGLTLVINVVLHDFWNVPDQTQNFVKNMGIFAGLLVLAGLGGGGWSLDSKLAKIN
jgi:putative oxidoreductase|tara:strand:- start:412 stop:816 length:405 start_codon:yes stop_codon:yes gene_type:complete